MKKVYKKLTMRGGIDVYKLIPFWKMPFMKIKLFFKSKKKLKIRDFFYEVRTSD